VPSRIIVSTKLRPPTPKSHALRAMMCRELAAATDVSPASFERPYAEIGCGRSDST
jgi:hypothetical protein